MDKLKLLRAIYEAIQWDRLYRALPGLTRQEVDDFFRELRERAAELPDAPEPQAPQAVGEEARLYCDGASSGNPGPAGVGMVLKDPDGTELLAWGAPIGEATNNVAEYRAAIAGLTKALELGVRRIRLLSDSQLLVRQLQGAYKVKNAGLKPLHAQVAALLAQFEAHEVAHIPREQNARADKLATAAAKNNR